MKSLAPAGFTVAAVAENATTPVPQGGLGSAIWSSTTNAVMKWNGTKWMSLKRSVVLKMCSADYTPSATGLDFGGLVTVPYEPNTTGRVSIAWTVTDIIFRCETPGTTSSTLQIARSTGTGVFSNTGYLNSTVLTISANAYESGTPALAVTTVNSGDKLAPNFNTLGTGMGNVTIYVVLCES